MAAISRSSETARTRTPSELELHGVLCELREFEPGPESSEHVELSDPNTVLQQLVSLAHHANPTPATPAPPGHSLTP